MKTSERCVLLFSRSPELEGSVKHIAEARPLFELSRRRLADAVCALPGIALVHVGRGSLPGVAERLEQRGRSFGERVENAFQDVFALGYTEVVVVASDVPALGPEHLAAAFAALGAGRVAVGPSPDGGVYLIGLSSGMDVAALLEGVRWKTPRVAIDLVGRAAAAGGAVSLLPALRDVDGRRDLLALARDPRLDAGLALLVRSILARAAPRATREDAPALVPAARLAAPRGPPAPAA